jgi:hypothetical protein
MAKLAFGSFYFDQDFTSYPDNIIETPVTADTPTKALGPTTAGELADFTMSANNRLLCNVTVERTYYVSFHGSITKDGSGASNTVSGIYKNGVFVPGALIRRKISSATDEGAFPSQCVVKLISGDYIELWVQSDNSENVSITVGGLAVMTVG